MKHFYNASAPALVRKPPRARSDLVALFVSALWGALILWLLRFV